MSTFALLLILMSVGIYAHISSQRRTNKVIIEVLALIENNKELHEVSSRCISLLKDATLENGKNVDDCIDLLNEILQVDTRESVEVHGTHNGTDKKKLN